MKQFLSVNRQTKHLAGLFILLSSFLPKLNAQQYYPLLDSALNRWTYISNYMPVRLPDQSQVANCTYTNPVFTSTSYQHYTGADTVINTKTYKILYQSNSGTCMYGFIREDTALQKVFFLDVNNAPEITLYDFSMQPGNTIYINFINNNGFFNTGTYLLDSIRLKAIHHAVGIRRVFYLHCTTTPGSFVLRWIEGIGNFENLVYPYMWNQQSFGWFNGYCQGDQYNCDQFLTCFEHNQKVYYDSCARQTAVNNNCLSYQDTCDYWNICSGIHELSSLSSFNFYPNPASSMINTEIEMNNPGEITILVWDITGKQELKKLSLGKIAAGKQEAKLDCSSLTDGFYLVECRSPQGSLFRKLVVQH